MEARRLWLAREERLCRCGGAALREKELRRELFSVAESDASAMRGFLIHDLFSELLGFFFRTACSSHSFSFLFFPTSNPLSTTSPGCPAQLSEPTRTAHTVQHGCLHPDSKERNPRTRILLYSFLDRHLKPLDSVLRTTP
jgi:hypothetical protein